MLPRISRVWALLCLVLLLQLTTARHIQLIDRKEDKDPAITATGSDPKPGSEPEPTATATDGTSVKTNAKSSGAETDAPEPTSSVKKGKDDSHTTTFESSTSFPTSVVIMTNGPLDNDTFHNATIPHGQLPLTPELTPGWGVAGVVMLVTGLIHALIGIKNRWIHTFFSIAFITSLGVAVLIIYVMSLPVSDALQGGYVAAVILSGCVAGTLSIFFKELTEGLGCALGGFSVSMWLLCLVPGGLLKAVSSKSIFIGCFTLVGIVPYFSRYTRDWALILMISFSGATVAVLGIDCFSRAGLKEFWAYQWKLNKNLFPLGTKTYPVTRGIRVETAAIFIIFMVGIVSQVKLWRIVKEKRAKRAAEREEGQRNLDQEEENIGRQLEEANGRDRQEWERVYGNQDHGSSGEVGSEKKLRDSYAQRSEGEVIEMADMSESDRGVEPLTEKDKDGKVTVRVAHEDAPEGTGESDDEAQGSPTSDVYSGARSRAVSSKKRRSQRTSVSETPEVVPLPFTVPNEEDTKSHRSSVATFADEAGSQAGEPAGRDSFAKRVSQGSSRLLRNFSLRSGHRRDESLEGYGESEEELVVPKGNSDDASSLAATMDRQSMDSSHRHSMLAAEGSPDIEIKASLSKDDPDLEQPQGTAQGSLDEDGQHGAKNLGNPSTDDDQAGSIEASHESSEGKSTAEEAADPTSLSRADVAETSMHGKSEKPKSISSEVSAPVSLTKERLPHSLSRVAMSYRTNEWAKHLSYADAPAPDELIVPESPKKAKLKERAERVAPLNVEELQQNPADGVPPAIPRSDSRASSFQGNSPVMASPSSPGKDQTFTPPLGMGRSLSAVALRRTSSTFEPIAEERDPNNGPTPILEEQGSSRPISTDSSPVTGEQGQTRSPTAGAAPWSNPHTLLGQRESYLRSKSQGNLLVLDPSATMSRTPSETGSLNNYSVYASAPAVDPDDIPLSQRKELLRHNSLMALSGNQQQPMQRSSSGLDLTEGTFFNSYQPGRNSTLPVTTVREAQLANFRNSVAQDLRSGSPMMTPTGRETPFASTTNILGKCEAEVQRDIEVRRNMLLGQKHAEEERKAMNRREQQWADRAFTERMMTGDMQGAHRQALRKMQNQTKE